MPVVPCRPKIRLMDAQQIRISLHDESGGYEITPDRVPLSVLRNFTRDVDEFLRGERGEIDTSELDVAVVKGSLGVLTAPTAHPGSRKRLQIIQLALHQFGRCRSLEWPPIVLSLVLPVVTPTLCAPEWPPVVARGPGNLKTTERSLNNRTELKTTTRSLNPQSGA